MKSFEPKLPISKDCLTLIAVSLLGLALLIGVGILPMKQKIANADLDIEQARLNLELHEVMEPINLELDLRRKKDVRDFPPPVKDAALPQAELSQAEESLRSTASRFGLRIISIGMDLSAASKNTSGLEVNLKLKGGFDGIRHYLDAVSRLPYLGGISEVRIVEEGQDRVMDIKMVLRLT